MTVVGQSEKSGRSTGRSALSTTPDMTLHRAKLSFVPKAEVARLIDHLVGAGGQANVITGTFRNLQFSVHIVAWLIG